MFSKSTCLALFVLAFSTFSAQAAPAKGQGFETETFCNTATIALSTVVSTVTSTHFITTTASSAQSTGSSSSNNGGGNNNFNGGGSNAGEGNNGGNGNDDSSTTTAAASSTTTAASAPAGDNSGGGAATGTGSGSSNSGATDDAQAAQTSLTLDPNVVCSGFSDDGQNPPTAGQTASSTSTNNYINFCALTLPATPLTNGEQITSGSCNPAPIGLIPSTANMPSAKFQNPPNFGTIPANTAFTIDMALKGMQAGIFTNAQKTYFAAPQQLNAQGQIKGHSHFVVEALDSLAQTTPTDPTKFVFFKGIDDAGTNGVLSTAVTAGVPAGAYRICSINTSSNHQPVIVPIAQHGSLDDCIYFTASDNATAANATSAASASAIVSASASAVESASASAVVSAAVPAASSVAAGAAAVPAGAAAVPADAAAVPAAVPAGKAGAAAVPAAAAAVPAAAAAVPAGKAAVPTAKGKGAAVPTAVSSPAAAVPSVPAKAGAKGAAAAAVPAASSAAAATASGKGAAAAAAAAPASGKGAAAAAAPASGKNNNKAQGKGRRRLRL
jgi:hypothetical protein